MGGTAAINPAATSPSTAKGRHSGLALPWLASSLAIVASLVHYLHFHDYPLFSVEGLILCAVVGAMTLVVSMMFVRVSPLGQSVLTAFLYLLLLLIHAHPGIALAGSIAAFVARFRFGVEPLRLLLIIAMVVLGFVAFGLSEQRGETVVESGRPGARATQLPGVIHLILDEHAGGADLQRLSAADRQIERDIMGRYRSMGFDVWPNAYSPHFRTAHAVPHLLGGQPAQLIDDGQRGAVAGPLDMFETAREQGYRIEVYQTSFFDFCKNNGVDRCLTVPIYSLVGLRQAGLSPGMRALLVGQNYLSQSPAFEQTLVEASRIGVRLGRPRWRTHPIAKELRLAPQISLGLWKRFNRDARDLRPGELMFAHLIFPHYPYAFTRDCRHVPVDQWDWRQQRAGDSEQVRKYGDQLRCAAKMVEDLRQSVAASPAGRNFRIVVHGDHGSRLMRGSPRAAEFQKLEDDVLRAGFSTFFAYRKNDGRGRCYSQQVDIADLVRSVASDRHPGLLEEGTGRSLVWLEDEHWLPVKRLRLPGWDSSTCAKLGQ